ncbi:MAG: flagellar hook capping FlgD N-terminal domain-containing protein [Betaproteobacteria bacterium]
MSTVSTATQTAAPLPNGILRYEDHVAAEKSKPQGGSAMGQGAFLTLFTTQLKNQDPTDPVKNEAFVAQLAQFSQLEATTAMQKSLDTMVTNQSSDRMLTGASMVGRKVGVPNGPAVLAMSQPVNAVANLPTGADSVTLSVSDSKGKVIRTSTYDKQLPGDMKLTWDGTDDQGNQAPDGTYTFAINAIVAGSNTTPNFNTMATVRSAASAGTSDNTWLLNVDGGKSVSLSDVKMIN